MRLSCITPVKKRKARVAKPLSLTVQLQRILASFIALDPAAFVSAEFNQETLRAVSCDFLFHLSWHSY